MNYGKSFLFGVLFFVVLASCGQKDIANYNPYQGSLIQLLPKEIDKYLLDEVKEKAFPIEYISKEAGLNPRGSIKSKYQLNQKAMFEINIGNFSSAEDADKFMNYLASKFKASTEDKKINGVIVGKKFFDEGDIYWSNGSLVVTLYSQEKNPLEMLRDVESKLEF